MMHNQRRFREAVELHISGKFAEAAERYAALQQLEPQNPDVWHLQGVALGQLGDYETSLKRIRHAIALKRDVPEYYQNLASTCENMKDKPAAAEAYNGLGNAWQLHHHYEAALLAYEKVLAIQPDNARTMSNYGAALNGLGRFDEALEWFEKALAKEPGLATALTNRGNALAATGAGEAALDSHRAALDGKGAEGAHIPDAHLNLGNALAGLGRSAEAMVEYERALALRPDSGLGHWNRALLLLLLGRYAEGWQEYEWRWQWSGYTEPRRGFPQPVWRGESASALGGPLLVTSEQGFGDVVQFARFVPLLLAEGHTVLFEVQRELYELCRESFSHPRLKVIVRQDSPLDIEGKLPFAAYTGLMSLPGRFEIVEETIPAPVPYLAVTDERAERWAKRLKAKPKTLKVGLVWAGRPEHTKDRWRSLDPAVLAPLLGKPGISFYSFQKGEAATRLADSTVEQLGDELATFADTAAALEQMDLLISVDTAVVHVAGALARPVWVMLPAVPDWRWRETGDSTPWYPTLKLFRQSERGDWMPVIAAMGNALDQLAKLAR
jgi:tetratricopeptide (TPR) repeat protein